MNLFTGLSVALATPFTPDFAVDMPAFRRVVRHTLDGGVENLVVLGSTGEAATILEAERDALITVCLEEAGKVDPPTARVSRQGGESGESDGAAAAGFHSVPEVGGIFSLFLSKPLHGEG